MSESDIRPKILIVDDQKENIDLLMELFRDQYRVAAATTPERALKVAAGDSPPDIVLLDILMPGMDGYEVCRRLKSDESTRNIPVLFVTAVSEVMDATKGFDVGAVDYITKPFHPPTVKARVRLHLDLKKKHELLETYAFLDALTEIHNRRRFEEVIEAEWNRARRSGQPLSLILMDVDFFKSFNDTYGHGQGDECLRRVAKVVAGSLSRTSDFVARYGGEEFMVLLPYTDHDQAMTIAGRLSEAVDELAIPHGASRAADHLTVSMGVATAHPNQDIGYARIVDTADTALYDAKHAGRHCVRGIVI